jgi:hypothetical protein
LNNLVNIINNNKTLIKLEKIFLLTNLIIFFFLWDVKYYLINFNINFDPRLLIIFSLIFIIFRIHESKNNIKTTFLLTFFITLHLIANLFYDETQFELKHLKNILSFFIIVIFSLHYKDLIILNIKKICLIFLFVSLTFLIMKNFYFINYKDIFFCGFFKTDSKFFKIIFQENSHFGMIAPPIIFYLLTTTNKLYENILFFIFIIICYLYSSTTLIFSLMLIFFIYLIFYYKKKFFLNNKYHFFLILTLIILSLTKYGCNRKLFEFTKLNFFNKQNYENHVNQIENYISTYFSGKELTNSEKTELLMNRIRAGDVSITTQVFVNGIEIAVDTFLDKRIFGYGINNYETAFKKSVNNRKTFNYINDVKFINKNDGSSTALKAIVEFGIFTLIIPIYLLYFLINKKIPINTKLFLFSIILCQSLRGAGYFNGGFLISMILIINLTHFNKNINYEKPILRFWFK